MTTACVYRHFDAWGRLLYVGMSMNAHGRSAEHLKASKWAAIIARIEVSRFETRGDALAAERMAIRVECPLYNRQGAAQNDPIPGGQERPLLLKTDAIKFAGSGAELARILGVTRQAVSLWGEALPPLQVYRLRAARPGWFRRK